MSSLNRGGKFSISIIFFVILFINGCQRAGYDLEVNETKCTTFEDVSISDIFQNGGSGNSYCASKSTSDSTRGLFCSSLKCEDYFLDSAVNCVLNYNCDFEIEERLVSDESDLKFRIECCISPSYTPESIAVNCVDYLKDENPSNIRQECIRVCEDENIHEDGGWENEEINQCILEVEQLISRLDQVREEVGSSFIAGAIEPGLHCQEFGNVNEKKVEACLGCCDVVSDDPILNVEGGKCCYYGDKVFGDPYCKLRPQTGPIWVDGLGNVILEYLDFDENKEPRRFLVWINVKPIEDPEGISDMTDYTGIPVEASRLPGTNKYSFTYYGENCGMIGGCTYEFEAESGSVCSGLGTNIRQSSLCYSVQGKGINIIEAACTTTNYAIAGIFISDPYKQDGKLQSNEVGITCCSLDVITGDYQMNPALIPDLPDFEEQEEGDREQEMESTVSRGALVRTKAHNVNSLSCPKDEFVIGNCRGLTCIKCAQFEYEDGTHIKWGKISIRSRYSNCQNDEVVKGVSFVNIVCAQLKVGENENIRWSGGYKDTSQGECNEEADVVVGDGWFWNNCVKLKS